MRLKAIQLNLYKGKYLDAAVDFLKKEDPDIIFLQEVTKGRLNYFSDKKADIFELLKDKLKLNGALDMTLRFVQFPEDYFGNAVFSRFPILNSTIVAMRDSGPLEYSFKDKGDSLADRPFVSRHLIDALIDIDGLVVHAISVHGAWTAPPRDTEENLRQAAIIVEHLKSLGNEPFILGGDLNMPPGTKVVDNISSAANNLISGSQIIQTTHPKVHKIVPKGFLVDYVFVSKHFKKISIEAPQVTVSDHLPVVAVVELDRQS